nr:uncharacterized protein LOC127327066 [Lolium perenne]
MDLVFFLHETSTYVEAPWASLATSCLSPPSKPYRPQTSPAPPFYSSPRPAEQPRRSAVESSSIPANQRRSRRLEASESSSASVADHRLSPVFPATSGLAVVSVALRSGTAAGLPRRHPSLIPSAAPLPAGSHPAQQLLRSPSSARRAPAPGPPAAANCPLRSAELHPQAAARPPATAHARPRTQRPPATTCSRSTRPPPSSCRSPLAARSTHPLDQQHKAAAATPAQAANHEAPFLRTLNHLLHLHCAQQFCPGHLQLLHFPHAQANHLSKISLTPAVPARSPRQCR